MLILIMAGKPSIGRPSTGRFNKEHPQESMPSTSQPEKLKPKPSDKKPTEKDLDEAFSKIRADLPDDAHDGIQYLEEALKRLHTEADNVITVRSLDPTFTSFRLLTTALLETSEHNRMGRGRRNV